MSQWLLELLLLLLVRVAPQKGVLRLLRLLLLVKVASHKGVLSQWLLDLLLWCLGKIRKLGKLLRLGGAANNIMEFAKVSGSTNS